ncbi:hypothetical protein CI674_024405 [Escherichia coli]|nr:hypothetical protein CI674_024405 [Escherichia coli]
MSSRVRTEIKLLALLAYVPISTTSRWIVRFIATALPRLALSRSNSYLSIRPGKPVNQFV